MSLPGPLAPGDQIGLYRVERRLGAGGMGVVVAARDTGLDRTVALKVIAPALADDPAFRARFTREAQAQASLDSPHVVHVYAHGEADGHLYLATQLVPDGDLGAMLRAHGAPPLRTAVDLIAQVASGLADAHAAGLVHRDIKPANVLLRQRAGAGVTAYLADFGIARPVTAAPSDTTVGTVGTPGFMAPELHDGAPATVASDVYSVGCLLWTTLTGRPPYPGATDFQVMTAHRDQPVPQLPGAGAQVDGVNRVLRRAMAKRPGDRHPSAAHLRDELRALLALPDTPVPLRATVPDPATPEPARRARPVAVALAVAAVVVLAGLLATAYAVWGGDDADPPAATPGTSTTTPATPATPTEEQTDEPPPSPDGPVTTPELDAAVASLAEALEGQGMLDAAQSECAARAWIDEAGLEHMASAGFFEPDGTFVDRPQEEMTPEMRSAALSAVTGCLTG